MSGSREQVGSRRRDQAGMALGPGWQGCTPPSPVVGTINEAEVLQLLRVGRGPSPAVGGAGADRVGGRKCRGRWALSIRATKHWSGEAEACGASLELRGEAWTEPPV